ncbi:HutD family protein [Caulobacter sp. KR2-114]|uniref:HutD/Ves family protein n=1 Tax=Caulobacter sp. KR2-114 TaxID=3400912 RepID=UPI003BFEC107
MRILRAADRRATRWKNGGGVTREVAAWPPDAGVGAFEWRLSLAEITRDGPFSTFHGVDRSLTVVEGEALALDVDGERHCLGARARLAFPGEAAVAARLRAGLVRDFNVMVRRDAWRACVADLSGGPVHAACGGPAFLLALCPGRVAFEGAEHRLERLDVAHLSAGETATLMLDGAHSAVLVALEPVLARPDGARPAPAFAPRSSERRDARTH